MSRFSHYDTDDERLPEGMRRVGYDAHTQVYTFQDADGSYWEGAPGCEYGQLTRVGDPVAATHLLEAEAEAEAHHLPATSWSHDMMPLLNFLLLIGLCLLLLFWFLRRSASAGELQQPQVVAAAGCGAGAAPYTLRAGDTCWALGEHRGVGVDGVLARNRGLDCHRLVVGASICLPE